METNRLALCSAIAFHELGIDVNEHRQPSLSIQPNLSESSALKLITSLDGLARLLQDCSEQEQDETLKLFEQDLDENPISACLHVISDWITQLDDLSTLKGRYVVHGIAAISKLLETSASRKETAESNFLLDAKISARHFLDYLVHEILQNPRPEVICNAVVTLASTKTMTTFVIDTCLQKIRETSENLKNPFVEEDFFHTYTNIPHIFHLLPTLVSRFEVDVRVVSVKLKDEQLGQLTSGYFAKSREKVLRLSEKGKIKSQIENWMKIIEDCTDGLFIEFPDFCYAVWGTESLLEQLSMKIGGSSLKS